jgi:hypothetical protein
VQRDSPQGKLRPAAVVGYALWRLIGTARIALFTVGGVIMVALLAEVLH